MLVEVQNLWKISQAFLYSFSEVNKDGKVNYPGVSRIERGARECMGPTRLEKGNF